MKISDLKAAAASKDPIFMFYLKWGSIYAGILLISVIAIGLALYSGARVRAEITALKGRITAMPEANLTAEQRDELMKSIQATSAAESRQFITAADIPTAFGAISSYAMENNVTLKRINTIQGGEAPVAEAPFVEVPIVFDIEGDYLRVGDFLSKIQNKLQWDFTWERVDFSPKTATAGTIQGSLRITFYSRKT
jgi:Tfp pilus assembly protein PilO